MAFETKPRVINLEGNYTIDKAQDLKNLFMSSIEPGHKTFVSLTGVENMDLSCLQVVLSLLKEPPCPRSDVFLIGKLNEKLSRRLYTSGFTSSLCKTGEEMMEKRATFSESHAQLPPKAGNDDNDEIPTEKEDNPVVDTLTDAKSEPLIQMDESAETQPADSSEGFNGSGDVPNNSGHDPESLDTDTGKNGN